MRKELEGGWSGYRIWEKPTSGWNDFLLAGFAAYN
jgi:hypothetical protein